VKNLGMTVCKTLIAVALLAGQQARILQQSKVGDSYDLLYAKHHPQSVLEDLAQLKCILDRYAASRIVFFRPAEL